MANETITTVGPYDLFRSTDAGYDPKSFVAQRENIAAVPLSKTSDVFQFITRLPASATLTTGVKVDLLVVDDGTSPADLGKVAVLGAQVKTLADNTDSLSMATGAGTEVTANVTLASTAGVVRVLTISIPNASLDSLAASGHALIQIRRAGGASDTLAGTLLLLRASAYAY